MTTVAVRAPGRASRAAILDHAVRLAGSGGLRAATIGALSGRLGMSKSAVFAHFGSKPALDVAVVQAAAARVDAALHRPAAAAPPGVARLVALTEAWLSQAAARDIALAVLTGIELPPPGDARDALIGWRRTWRDHLAAQVARAIDAGELAATVPADVIAFEVDALLHAARRDVDAGDGAAVDRARYAIERLLRRWAAGAPPP